MSRQEVLAARLERVHAVLQEAGIWHTLAFGSLLGAVRDGQLIEWDHDIDLLIRRDDIPRILALNDVLDHGVLWFWSGYGAASLLALNPGRVPWIDQGYLSIMDGSGSGGELYAPTLFDDGVLRLYDLDREAYFWPQSSFPAWFVEELDSVEMRGVTYPIPRAAPTLLELTYGDDWRTPVRSAFDGGEPRDDRLRQGDVGAPNLHAQIDWCIAQGWDRSVYRDRPHWPRDIRAAGPRADAPRTRNTSRSCWWHTLDELAEHY